VLPPSQLPSFPLQACEVVRPTPLGVGTDAYYGLSFYLPPDWHSEANGGGSFWGIAIAQLHFQNIWGSPIELELHGTHLTLALETGACNSHLTRNPGCRWRSNADAPHGSATNLPGLYAIPRPLLDGMWHEVIMRVRWAADSSGAIQVWTRSQQATGWTQTVHFTGFPTVQWDRTRGCCETTAADKIGAYRGVSATPVAVWLGGIVVGTSFQAVSAALPGIS